MINKRILLLSAYDAYSHQQWRETLVDMFPQARWTVLALPPRYFAWRVRGNSLSWAFNHRRELADNYDLVIATSVTDLSSLRGFVPSLSRIPTLVYFHENQFSYPVNHGAAGTKNQSLSIEPQITSIYSALCADQLAFNSDWNRRSFMQGAGALLRKLPDHVPADLIGSLQAKSLVLPVPLSDHLFAPSAQRKAKAADIPLQIVWNHRHEYDKGPLLLLGIINRLIHHGLPFQLHLLGQRFRREPSEFATVREVLDRYYSASGIAPGRDQWLDSRQDYLALIQSSDLVLSTAQHDFQGLSVLEACALGCVPSVPDELAYPEYVPDNCRFAAFNNDIEQQADSAADLIETWTRALCVEPRPPAPDISRLSVSAIRPDWDRCLSQLIRA